MTIIGIDSKKNFIHWGQPLIVTETRFGFLMGEQVTAIGSIRPSTQKALAVSMVSVRTKDRGPRMMPSDSLICASVLPAEVIQQYTQFNRLLKKKMKMEASES